MVSEYIQRVPVSAGALVNPLSNAPSPGGQSDGSPPPSRLSRQRTFSAQFDRESSDVAESSRLGESSRWSQQLGPSSEEPAEDTRMSALLENDPDMDKVLKAVRTNIIDYAKHVVL